MSRFSFKTFNPATGATLEFIPDVQSAEISFEFSDVGSIKIKYPKAGTNFASLNLDRVEVGVFCDGVEIEDGRFIIESSNADELEETSTCDFSGRSILQMAKYAIVYPLSGTSVATSQTFTSTNPGIILRTLFQQNSTRGGVMASITWASFSNTTDSNGVAWALGLNAIEYKVGTSYLDIIRNLVDNGLIEVKMVGRDLRVYNAGGMGVDRTTQAVPVTLQKGRDLEEAPTTSTSEQIAGVALIEGDEGVLRENSNSTTNAAWGRRETYISQGGIKDSTTLAVVAANQLSLLGAVRRQKTRKVQVDSTPWIPSVSYRVSDYVYSVTTGVFERMRVRQIVLGLDANGLTSASLVLNDKFLENEIQIARKVNGILGGASAGGSIAVPISTPTPGTDPTIPAQVTGLGFTSAAFRNERGIVEAQVTAAWADVTTNTDSSAIDDLDYYEVQWKRASDSTWWPAGNTTANSLAFSQIPPNVNINVRVRAVDRNANRGAFSATAAGLTASDATAPPVPSTPLVVPYLGQLRIYWDGLGSAGETQPTDFKWVEVHFSATNGFTPSASTLMTTMNVSGYEIITDLPYATTHYVKLISVDTSGNKSAASAQGSAATERVTGLDVAALAIETSNLGDGAVTTAKIANLTVTTAKIGDLQVVNAKIADLAVDDAKIGNMSVGKLTAGSLVADVTVSARIKTANTGARVELNSSGIQAFNSGGSQTVSVAASTGAVTITGAFKTGFSGTRLGIDNTVSTNTITFYPSTGSQVGSITSSEVDATGAVRMQMYSSQFPDPDNGGVLYGNRLEVGQLFRLGGYRVTGGTDYGGVLYGDRTQFIGGWGNGVDRGSFRAFRDSNREVRMETGTQDAPESYLTMNKLGNVELFTPGVKFNWDTNSAWNITSMRLPNFADLGANGWLTGFVGAAGGTSWTVNYGTTRNPTPVPMITPRFTGGIGWALTTSNNTGFVVTAASTTSGGIHFICYRV